MKTTWHLGVTVEDAGASSMDLPTAPFVGLFGNFQTGDATREPWRRMAARHLTAEHIAWFDPHDTAWSGISHANGDAMQPVIDALVATQQRALRACACSILYVGTPPAEDSQLALASRCEFAMLVGLGTPTFAVIGERFLGRNYLTALARTVPTIKVCATLASALDHVTSFMHDTYCLDSGSLARSLDLPVADTGRRP